MSSTTASLEASGLFNVKGMVAVITGGGTGLGLIMARTLAINGASRVYIIGRRLEPLQEAAQNCPTNNIRPLVGDVTSKDSLLQVAKTIEQETGHINLLVCNSGVMGPRAPAKPESLEDFVKAWETPMEAFTHPFAVNVVGVYYTALAFLKLLDKGNKAGNIDPAIRSQIVTTSSIAGFSRLKGSSFTYNASKAAAMHLTKMLGTYFVEWKIRCNVIAPGLFPSDLAAPILGGMDTTKEGAFDRSIIPAERTGTEEEMAGTILYVTSRAGAYLNGNVLVVDEAGCAFCQRRTETSAEGGCQA